MYFEEKLDLVLQKLSETQQLLELFIPDLRKKRAVALFLGVTETTILNWLKESDSPISEGVHYVRKIKGDIEFVASEIITLKRIGKYKNRRESKPIKPNEMKDNNLVVNNATTRIILNKIGKMSVREVTPKGEVL